MSEKLRTVQEFLCGKSIETCMSEVCIKNKINLKAFSVLGIIMMSFSLAFGWAMRHVFTFNVEFIFMWLYFVFMYAILKFIDIKNKYVIASFYMWLTPLMLMGIIIGTFGDPLQPSITIMVFLCVLPMFILDKPWRIILFILVSSSIYTVCCYFAKSSEMFIADMIDLVLFTVLGVGVNCLILRDRINNVEYAMQMKQIAETDALTELYNRRAGEEIAKALIKQNKSGMFLLVDFDNFKEVNDNYGHVNGDLCLKTVAYCLKEAFRENDIVMRFGGDEFAVYAKGLKTRAEGKKCLERMMQKIHSLIIPEMPGYKVSVSAGAAFAGFGQNKTFEEIYSESDAALYESKRKGKNTYCFFEDI